MLFIYFYLFFLRSHHSYQPFFFSGKLYSSFTDIKTPSTIFYLIPSYPIFLYYIIQLTIFLSLLLIQHFDISKLHLAAIFRIKYFIHFFLRFNFSSFAYQTTPQFNDCVLGCHISNRNEQA